ncbi:MAG: acyltransferase family protein [Leucobacter sp.]
MPYPDAWNGSLWTLYYEFLCYLFIGVLLIWTRARSRVWPVATTFALSVVLYVNIDFVLTFFDGNVSFRLLSMLLPYFLGSALIRVLLPILGLNWIPGSLSLVVVVLGIEFGPSWSAQLLAPLLAYGLLWLSTAIRQPQWVARNDISYGLYVYAFPVQQLLALFGLTFLDPITFSVIAFIGAGILAAGSWFLVERPALRRARQATGRTADRVLAKVPPGKASQEY